MLPRRSWLPLLAGADSIASLAALARTLGFGDHAPLDDASREAFGFPHDLYDAHLAAGPGATRALLLRSRDGGSLRHQLGRLAARLAARAPHLLWLVLVSDAASAELAVATWTSDRLPPKVAALLVDRTRILGSDVETIAALAAAVGGNDLCIHARWHELLGREMLSGRFYAALEHLVGDMARAASGRARDDDRREIALLNVSRLLFLAFLESKGWLAGDRSFLARVFDDCMRSGGGFHRRVLWPLFFGTLNTRPARRAASARAFGRIPFLNGGLFQRSAGEARARTVLIRDEDWARFYDELLLRYRFTAREQSGDWNEAAIDPEMLGRAFESLMASRERRNSGAYFTPQPLVERITETALEASLDAHGIGADPVSRALRGQEPDPDVAATLRAVLPTMRILDPACGSGALLVHALEVLTTLRCAAGDARERHHVRRVVLTESVFGVDVNPIAVWLCELRLWLAVVIDYDETDPLRVTPLPNLDHNVRCGDALAGGDFTIVSQRSRSPGASAAHGVAALARLRTRYAHATAGRKRTLARALDRAERAEARAWLEGRLGAIAQERRSLLAAARGRDLFGARRGVLAGERRALAILRARGREIRHQLTALEAGGAIPFAFAAHFPDVAARGGFDIVIGNPPWVRLHRISSDARDRLRRDFLVYREAAWESGARDARAGRGFAAQVDLASLFLERSVSLARPNGAISLLVPSKLWRSLAGGGVRRLLHEGHDLRVLEDWSEAPAVFDAAVYPALVVARRVSEPLPPDRPGDVRVAVHRGSLAISWKAARSTIPLDHTPGAPWLVLPPDARQAFDRVVRHGVPLTESGIGQPSLGVKCGCNEAFLVRRVDGVGRRAGVRSGTRTAEVEADLVRPVLRGEDVRPWRAGATPDRSILFPYGDDGRVLRSLPPGVRAWLLPYRRQLLQRADVRDGKAWWSLFRTAAAVFDRPRVVWADVGRAPQALVLPAGNRTVPINSCYVVVCRDLEDALALAALLNSTLAAAWLGAIAEPARGGYHRFLAWTVARLPVPDDWQRARTLLAPLGAQGVAGNPPSRSALLEAVLEAYRLRLGTVAPLLGWMTR